MSKVSIVVAAAAGYVMGAKAGHERYEQIKTQAVKVWKDPRVQEKATQAQDVVKENAPKVGAKVADAASAATAKAKDVAGTSSNEETGPSSTTPRVIHDGPAGTASGDHV